MRFIARGDGLHAFAREVRSMPGDESPSIDVRRAVAFCLAVFAANTAFAQEEAPADEPVPTEAPSEQPAEFAPPPPTDPPPPVVIKEELVAEQIVEEKKATPSLKLGIGLRSGLSLSLNNASDRAELFLSDSLDQVMIRPYFSGQLTERVSVTANLEATANSVHVLDAILQLKLIDEFQVWIGQHIPASDRSSFCGPFYHNSWNFPITVQTFPFDTAARDRGITLWGLVADGILKYHVSVVDLQPRRAVENARNAGRVTLNLLDPENYYYASGTYYGAQDTLAIGAVAQYQKGSDGTATTDTDGNGTPDDSNGDGELDNDFVGFSFDLLFEKNLGAGGTITLEGGYWTFDGSGDEYVVNQDTGDAGKGFTGPQPGQSFLVALSWLTPKRVGPGFMQPNARFQWADYGNEPKTIDAGIAYVVDGFNHRWHLNYQHISANAGNDSDAIQLGAQLQL